MRYHQHIASASHKPSLSHPPTYVPAPKEEVHAGRTYSRLIPGHTRAGTRWSSFLYEKGSPRGNLARVLVVHLVEGGSSTTGEQTNCDLTRYVKKEANHVGPTLEARLYTLEYFLCVPSTRRTRRSLLTTPLPRPRARWFAGRGEGFDYNALSLALALTVDVQQFNRCQIARSIHYTTTSAIIVRFSE